jgi:hypothetical protein
MGCAGAPDTRSRSKEPKPNGRCNFQLSAPERAWATEPEPNDVQLRPRTSVVGSDWLVLVPPAPPLASTRTAATIAMPRSVRLSQTTEPLRLLPPQTYGLSG